MIFSLNIDTLNNFHKTYRLIEVISEDLILDEIERIQHDFEDMDVEVRCEESFDEFDIGGRKIRLVKRSTIKLPFWLAVFLEEEKYVTILNPPKIDRIILNTKRVEEEKNPYKLQDIDKYFYLSAKKTYQELVEKGKMASAKDKETMEKELFRLLRMRLPKIVKMAETDGINISSQSRNLTPEERWLCKLIANAVNKWSKTVNFDIESD